MFAGEISKAYIREAVFGYEPGTGEEPFAEHLGIAVLVFHPSETVVCTQFRNRPLY